MLFGLDRLKKLQEEQFGDPEGGDSDDYSLDAKLNDDDEDTPPPADDDIEETTEDTPPEDGEDEGGEEEGNDENTEEGGDDYTMEGNDDYGDGDEETPPEDGEDEGEGDNNEEPTGDDNTDGTAMEEDSGENQTNIKQKERLLTTFKKFYDNLSDLSITIGERISPLNQKEEYLHKIIIDNLESTKTLLYKYITELFPVQDYESNLYQLYYFSSQIEMIQILLKKIRTYREDMKNNIIKK